ncbi:MAG: hypothetical protein KUG72_02040 [Pseudomonadales bacterium]|nr:hypothetical protein [Pseudomonadales bacterium]
MHSFSRNYIPIVLLALISVLSGCEQGLLGSTDEQTDAVAVDYALAYVKRPVPVDEDGDPVSQDLREVVEFNPGAQLIIRDRASVSADDQVITDGVFAGGELYDVKDLRVSYDGERVLFSMRAPDIAGADDDEQPKWNIWEYDLTGGSLTRVIASDITAEAGHDISPTYLPDGRILFSSSRQRQSKATLLDESKPQFAALDEQREEYAMMLHVMNSDGSNIRQITFNPSHDLDPTVLNDGTILYSRWDHFGNLNQINLYTANPDGTEHSLLYGHNSHDTGSDGSTVQFVGVQQSQQGDVLALLQPMSSLHYGGDIVKINTDDAIDNAQASIFDDLIDTEEGVSVAGRYSSFFPLYDDSNRMLVSWSQCRLQETDPDTLEVTYLLCSDDNIADPDTTEASPMYGIWMIDSSDDTRLPVVIPEQNKFFTDVVVMQERTLPPMIADKQSGVELDASLVDEELAVIHIRSVYDIDGVDSNGVGGIATIADPALTLADDRPARFLRIVKSVSIPDDDTVDLNGRDFGRSTQQLMREIIGYVPIEPDGSVKMKVPANVPLVFSVLDKAGKRITARHGNWIQFLPGEELECVGCHQQNSGLPHGRADMEAPSIHPGAPVGGNPFPNTEPALLANLGETMATTYSDANGVRVPTVDVHFVDEWTDDPTVRPKDVSFSYQYADLTTDIPTSAACQATWSNLCRITINYAEHIHPIWQQTREVLDVDMVTVLADNNCQGCHSSQDAMGDPQVPIAQLDLRDGPSSDEPEHLTSYRELLFNDNSVVLDGGALLDEQIPLLDINGDQVFEVDEDGELVLFPPITGDPVPVFVTITVSPVMRTAGANSSAGFYSLFETGGSHASYLSGAELKLIYEWLDIGAQYYNNPFDAPQ